MDEKRVERQYKEKQAQKEAFEKELEEQDGRISRLRVLYDQYFMGIEKIEPLHVRGVVEKTFLRSKIPRRGSTAMKFRYRSLQQKFTSYSSYWDRLVRLIEEGKIRRGVSGHRPAYTGIAGEEAKAPLASKRRRFVRDRIGLEGASLPHKDEFRPDELQELYSSLVAARTAAGEDSSKLTPELLKKSVDRILSRVKNQDIRLKITHPEGGKVSLAAVLKKKGTKPATD